MSLPTLEQIEAAYKATGIKPIRKTWCKKTDLGAFCACPLGVVVAEKLGYERLRVAIDIDDEDYVSDMAAMVCLLGECGFDTSKDEVRRFVSGVDDNPCTVEDEAFLLGVRARRFERGE